MSYIGFDRHAAARNEVRYMRSTVCEPTPITAAMRCAAAFACLRDAWGEAETVHVNRLAERVKAIASL